MSLSSSSQCGDSSLDGLSPKGTEAVLQHIHVALLKRLAKLTANVDLHVSIRNGKVRKISHEISHLVIEE
jgi:hypothetical protein